MSLRRCKYTFQQDSISNLRHQQTVPNGITRCFEYVGTIFLNRKYLDYLELTAAIQVGTARENAPGVTSGEAILFLMNIVLFQSAKQLVQNL